MGGDHSLPCQDRAGDGGEDQESRRGSEQLHPRQHVIEDVVEVGSRTERGDHGEHAEQGPEHHTGAPPAGHQRQGDEEERGGADAAGELRRVVRGVVGQEVPQHTPDRERHRARLGQGKPAVAIRLVDEVVRRRQLQRGQADPQPDGRGQQHHRARGAA